MSTPEKQKGNRTVWDAKGTSYDLKSKLGEGGQGMVCTTQYPNVLVKVSLHPTKDERTIDWFNHITWISRQPLEGLHIARPQALIVKPRLGYVMELMDGLESLRVMMQISLDGLREGGAIQPYLETGGVQRRIRLLAKLARSLAAIHGKALAYGDLSPANIFVSKDIHFSEAWLIDCDNLSVLSRDASKKVYTPDYGAPEILRGETGISSLTDSWSFAVIAFQLLTTVHPFKGDMVENGSPELENEALIGQLPWIDNPTDNRNRTSNGLPREQVLTKRLRECFERCFNEGLNQPDERPSMAEWGESLEAACMLLAKCETADGCGHSYIFNLQRKCPFCGHIQPEKRSVLLRHYVFAPKSDLGEDATDKDQWLRTNELQLIDWENSVEIRSSPVGSSTYFESRIVLKLTLAKEGLLIEPTTSPVAISFHREPNKKPQTVTRKMVVEDGWRNGQACTIHIGEIDKLHTAWRFNW